MDIFETIKVFHTPRLLLMNFPHPSAEEKQQAKVEWQLFEEAEKIACSYEAYSELTANEGHMVALAALSLFDTGPKTDDYKYLPHIVLTNLANIVPGSLTGLYQQLLARDLAWNSNSLFREADSATRDQIIFMLESEEKDSYTRQDLLCALAWIGDQTAQRQFEQWRNIQPAWSASLFVPLDEYTTQAGWELTEGGERRDLYYHECYSLEPIDVAHRADMSNPVAVVTPHEELCGWCQRPLITLFDFDLRDPRLSFLNIQGQRIRIAMCMNCSLQNERVFTDIDITGGSHWSDSNGTRPSTLRWYDEQHINATSLPQQHFALGILRRTPYASQGSQIGGCPEWVQDADYPRCPGCEQRMTFIGQLEPHIDYIEGIIYAFLCLRCGKVATGYQQT